MATVVLTFNIVNGTLVNATEVMQDLNDILAQLNGNVDTTNLITNSYDWGGPALNVAAPAVDAEAMRFSPPHPNMRFIHLGAYVEGGTVTLRIRYSTDNFATSTDLIAGAGTLVVVAGVANAWSGAALTTGLVMGPAGQIRIETPAVGAGPPANLVVQCTLKGLLRIADANP